MPSEPAPVFLLLVEVVVAVFLCLTVPPPPVLGVIALLGDRPIAPIDVQLGATGLKRKYNININIWRKEKLCLFSLLKFYEITYHRLLYFSDVCS